MPRRAINPLIKLAKLMPLEIDKFARQYDLADDKKAFVRTIGDLHNLPEENKSIYAKDFCITDQDGRSFSSR